MIQIEEIGTVLDRYLARFPEERDRLAMLLSAIDSGSAITDRANGSGHLTCSIVIIDPEGRVLHVRHNSLRTWLRPGGHVEPQDVTLPKAALRELEEEAGIAASVVSTVDETDPLDIDVRMIPANPAKGEPEHRHFDLRYAFTVSRPPSLDLEMEEVNAYAWIPASAIEPVALRLKVVPIVLGGQHGGR